MPSNKIQSNGVAEASLKEKEGISAIWLLPLVALLVGLWLIYKGVVEAPLSVTIHFDDGTGIAVGKTEVLYEGIHVGKVSDMVLADEGGVTVTAELDQAASRLLNEETQLWLVKPELSLAGVSGLDTILSGNYITLSPGGLSHSENTSKPVTNFVALKEPPPLDSAVPGLHLKLLADDLGSLGHGSPVEFKKLTVGYVDSYNLENNGQHVAINIFIEPKYESLVNKSSRFWLASGITIEGNLNGVKIKTESVRDIILGGLSFDTPDSSAAEVSDGVSYPLFADFEQADAGVDIRLTIDNAKHLVKGETEILFRGMSLGTIKNIDFDDEKPYGPVTVTATISPQAEAYLTDNAVFWLDEGSISLNQISGLSGLLRGAFIGVRLGDLNRPSKRDFIAQNERPILDYGTPGLHVTVHAEDLGSIQRGSPIAYRQIQVGIVDTFRLLKDKETIEITLLIEPEYAHLVKKDTVFWNASGVKIVGGLGGFEIRTQSFKSIISGGLSFSTPPHSTASRAKNGDTFTLYADEASAQDKGRRITINFSEGEGLREDTPIKYKGIQVGKVTSAHLNSTLNGVVVEARIESSASELATQGAQFWVVKPKFGLAETKNLDTLVGGAYISVSPGKKGKRQREFDGLIDEPNRQVAGEVGLNVVLAAKSLGSVKSGTHIFFRGIKVGEVKGFELSKNADQVLLEALIQDEYRTLIRENTVFWNASGIDVDFGLFSGAQIHTSSMESILAGGISFATPPTSTTSPLKPAVKNGAQFTLYAKAEEEWFDWSPSIPR